MPDQLLNRLRPAKNIDLLPLQLLHDRFNEDASPTNQGANWINGRIIRMHGQLAPTTTFPRNGLDLDDATRQFGHLFVKELRQQNLWVNSSGSGSFPNL